MRHPDGRRPARFHMAVGEYPFRAVLFEGNATNVFLSFFPCSFSFFFFFLGGSSEQTRKEHRLYVPVFALLFLWGEGRFPRQKHPGCGWGDSARRAAPPGVLRSARRAPAAAGAGTPGKPCSMVKPAAGGGFFGFGHVGCSPFGWVCLLAKAVGFYFLGFYLLFFLPWWVFQPTIARGYPRWVEPRCGRFRCATSEGTSFGGPTRLPWYTPKALKRRVESRRARGGKRSLGEFNPSIRNGFWVGFSGALLVALEPQGGASHFFAHSHTETHGGAHQSS